jgi:3-hydroxy-3-methylglutaryl CoA synthase/uncharacterized OB-fold protein
MGTKGIISYGVHVPHYRLSRKTIASAMDWMNTGAGPGEKAVANHDEDSITMACAAGINCLEGIDRSTVNGMYLATSTAPYRERGSAVIIAGALDLRPSIRTADFTDSLKAGTTALLSACDSVAEDGTGNVLLCASDCRLAKPGSAQEGLFGDGAAALLLGNGAVIASLEGSFSLSYDFPDYRRAEFDTFVRASEERFIREEGYLKFVTEAIAGLLKNYNLQAGDFAKVAYPCISAREHGTIAKKLGFQPEQVQEPLLNKIGESGVASPVLLLAAMLEDAKPGDLILLASYGNGADALCFKVTGEIEKVKNRKKLQSALNAGKEMTSYEKYCAFRGLLPVEVGIGGEVARTQLTLAWRERKTILGLYGSKCTRCTTPQYPPQRICVNPECGAIDEMEEYCFADKKGTLFSYTADYMSSTISPPLLYGVVDFEGGGRFIFELTDCEPDMVKTGLPVKMMLRRKYVDELQGVMGYFWKAVFTNG